MRRTPAMPVAKSQTEAVEAAKIKRSGGGGLRGGHGVHGVHWNGRGSGDWSLAAGRKWRLVTLETTPGGGMQIAASKHGGWVYTEQDPGVQDGNPGPTV
jgi:hypothetical protein